MNIGYPVRDRRLGGIGSGLGIGCYWCWHSVLCTLSD